MSHHRRNKDPLSPRIGSGMWESNRGSGPVFDPATLFEGGVRGAWIVPEPALRFQAANATTIAVAEGDPLGAIVDKSGNGINATQSVEADRPLLGLNPARFIVNKSNRNLQLDFGSSFSGHVALGMTEGVVHMEITEADGVWNVLQNPAYSPGNGEFLGIIAVEGSITPEQRAGINDYFASKGSEVDFANANFNTFWFYGRTDITRFYGNHWNTASMTNASLVLARCSNMIEAQIDQWDVSSVTNFSDMFRNCSDLESLDLSNWDMSSATTMARFCSGPAALTTVTLGAGGLPFSAITATAYGNAFAPSGLSQQSIDDILIGVEAAGTSGGTFNQSGGSAPSSAGEAAVTALRSRGWTVTVTGGF